MNALAQLQWAGYEFSLDGNGALRYVYRGAEPPGDWARPLLAEIRANRPAVAAVLAGRAPAADEPFTTHTRLRVVFPADTPLPFPAGRWRRLEDGRIEALLSYNDLRVMRLWRDELGIRN
jgi:hypothetical protein